ncbi:arylsulfatase [Saccharicrinis aurantiacus]|uniref:arylsulfatase n=1 Tax=Saccharicrinis aurantiacus TaxID=1849719 RepID=UPI0024925396|nr:arylsulfatase [Saccharicrinis aurantiacus]
MSKRILSITAMLFMVMTVSLSAKNKKPNIVVIWGDDIGIWNISAYNMGTMGYNTPNIDRIAQNGVKFTDFYAEQSCTAGRSAFITGQMPVRTGLTKVGMPGAEVGLSEKDPTIAEVLKGMGYNTAQFGKNHLGDKNEYLPTNHGFDEFLGNLYHLNAEEEPENVDYPKDPEFKKLFGPRGVIHSEADGPVKDTGPLTKKRMETVDDEFAAAAVDYIDRKSKDDEPFFLWFNSTRMHFRTHVKKETVGKSGQNFYADAMMEHDEHVGMILDELERLGLMENTIIMYGTDNGPHKNTWPDAATSPFRSEKNTTWEGGFRVPAMIQWKGHIPAGKTVNNMMSHLDWMPTFAAAAGNDNIAEELKKGKQIGDKTFKVHLDGYNFLPYLTEETDESPRENFFYFTDDGDLSAVRMGDWKIMFSEQRAQGTLQIWMEDFTDLRTPKLFNLRQDPFEEADVTSNTYYDWYIDHAYFIYKAAWEVQKMVSSFEEFPQRQKPASFNVEAITKAISGEKQQ